MQPIPMASKKLKIEKSILIGDRFGKIVIIGKPAPSKVIRGGKEYEYSNKSKWIAECDCGKECLVNTKDLFKNKNNSCGCSKNTKNLINIGQKIKNLTVVSESYTKLGRFYRHCICDCGRYCERVASDLVGNRVKTCGVCDRKLIYSKGSSHKKTHGMSKTTEYTIWNQMKNRCYKPNNNAYPDYGGRGITVCERWLQSFNNFYQDMGNRPEGKTLDRIDVNGDYEPSNCQWSNLYEQAKNKRNTVLFPYKGNMITRSEAARMLGLDVSYVCAKIKRPGMTIERIENEMRKPIAKK